MSKVTVTADQFGNIIGVSPNNPEYGYVRVEQNARQLNEGGWFKYVKRSALIKGTIEDLKNAKFKKGEELTGKIVVRESFEPINPNNTEKGLKIAGNSGVICRVDDQPIYRDTVFTTDLDAEDVLIPHNNSEEIKAAQTIDSLVATRNMVEASL